LAESNSITAAQKFRAEKSQLEKELHDEKMRREELEDRLNGAEKRVEKLLGDLKKERDNSVHLTQQIQDARLEADKLRTASLLQEMDISFKTRNELDLLRSTGGAKEQELERRQKELDMLKNSLETRRQDLEYREYELKAALEELERQRLSIDEKEHDLTKSWNEVHRAGENSKGQMESERFMLGSERTQLNELRHRFEIERKEFNKEKEALMQQRVNFERERVSFEQNLEQEKKRVKVMFEDLHEKRREMDTNLSKSLNAQEMALLHKEQQLREEIENQKKELEHQRLLTLQQQGATANAQQAQFLAQQKAAAEEIEKLREIQQALRVEKEDFLALKEKTLKEKEEYDRQSREIDNTKRQMEKERLEFEAAKQKVSKEAAEYHAALALVEKEKSEYLQAKDAAEKEGTEAAMAKLQKERTEYEEAVAMAQKEKEEYYAALAALQKEKSDFDKLREAFDEQQREFAEAMAVREKKLEATRKQCDDELEVLVRERTMIAQARKEVPAMQEELERERKRFEAKRLDMEKKEMEWTQSQQGHQDLVTKMEAQFEVKRQALIRAVAHVERRELERAHAIMDRERDEEWRRVDALRSEAAREKAKWHKLHGMVRHEQRILKKALAEQDQWVAAATVWEEQVNALLAGMNAQYLPTMPPPPSHPTFGNGLQSMGPMGTVIPMSMWQPYASVTITLGLITSIQSIFNRLDTDCDGRLSGEELGKWVSSKGVPITFENLRSMIAMADADNDGHLDFWEFLGVQVYLTMGLRGQMDLRDWMMFVSQSIVFDPSGTVERYNPDPQGLTLPMIQPSPPKVDQSPGLSRQASLRAPPAPPSVTKSLSSSAKGAPFVPRPPAADMPAAP